MARKASAANASKPAVKGRKPGRPPAHAVAKPGPKATVKAEPAAPARAEKSSPARPEKISKDELRARVETLEKSNATLRAKGRETAKSARQSAAQIADLEAQVARLEKRLTAQPSSPAKKAAPAKPPRRSRPATEHVDPASEEHAEPHHAAPDEHVAEEENLDAE